MSLSQILALVPEALWESIYMTIGSTVLAYVIGLPLGFVLVVTARDGIHPMRAVNMVLGAVVNFLRSIPFVILLFFVTPLTRLIVGRAIGSEAAIVPLVISAFPFVARMVEQSAKEVDRGVVEASQAMGASNWQIITKVLLPEARPSLINGAAVSATTILGYSAMAGCFGGGGLGSVAINYGYQRYDFLVMFVMIIVNVVLVQALQESGTRGARLTDKRIR